MLIKILKFKSVNFQVFVGIWNSGKHQQSQVVGIQPQVQQNQEHGSAIGKNLRWDHTRQLSQEVQAGIENHSKKICFCVSNIFQYLNKKVIRMFH